MRRVSSLWSRTPAGQNIWVFWVTVLDRASAGVMEQLEVGIIPYIVLLVVPVLGRMSDPSDSIRFMATQCFATLIRLLPLEVCPSAQGCCRICPTLFEHVCLLGWYSRPSSYVC